MSLPPGLPLGFKPRGSFFIKPEDAQCPLWVISGHRRPDQRCPFYPLKADMLSAERDIR
jgi:hypothetical protein